MLHPGSILVLADRAPSLGVIMGAPDAAGRYPALLLEEADAHTPVAECLTPQDGLPGPGRMRIDPYACCRLDSAEAGGRRSARAGHGQDMPHPGEKRGARRI